MKATNRSMVFIALLSAAVLAAGCETSDAKPSAGVSENVEGTQQELQKYSKETKEAVQSTKDYAYAVRAKFVRDMQNELATINGSLQQLGAKIESSNKATKSEAKAKLQVLRDRVAQLNRDLEQAKDAQESTWDQMNADFKKSHEDLKEAVAQARTWMSEKIAP